VTRSRLPRWTRRLALRVERFRLATRIRGLAGLIDVPHEVAGAAQDRIARLRRRAAAVARIIG
jgi:hypothetical protein